MLAAEDQVDDRHEQLLRGFRRGPKFFRARLAVQAPRGCEFFIRREHGDQLLDRVGRDRAVAKGRLLKKLRHVSVEGLGERGEGNRNIRGPFRLARLLFRETLRL